jgi:hypothetical protein
MHRQLQSTQTQPPRNQAELQPYFPTFTKTAVEVKGKRSKQSLYNAATERCHAPILPGKIPFLFRKMSRAALPAVFGEL